MMEQQRSEEPPVLGESLVSAQIQERRRRACTTLTSGKVLR